MPVIVVVVILLLCLQLVYHLRLLFVVCCCVLSAGLGEFRIRDLNDEINKLLREKRHWEERIIELGGTDYIVSSNHEGDGRE